MKGSVLGGVRVGKTATTENPGTSHCAETTLYDMCNLYI
jgi:hypothetical protein